MVKGRLAMGRAGFSSKEIERRQTRLEILRGLATFKPEVLKDIYSKVFPLLEGVKKEHNTPPMSIEGVKYYALKSEHPENEKLAAFCKELLQWLTTYNLKKDWLVKVAIFTLEAWYIKPKLAETKKWKIPSPVVYDERGEKSELTFTYPGNRSVISHKFDNKRLTLTIHLEAYNPAVMNRSAYKKRMCRSFSHIVDKYITSQEANLRQKGFNRALIKKRPEWHIQCFIDHMVNEKSPETIAQEYLDSDPSGEKNIATDAIKKAIKSISILSGWEQGSSSTS